MRKRVLTVIAAALVLSMSRAWAEKYPERWVYLSQSLRDDEGAARGVQLLRDAKASGCTHVLFVSTRGHRLPKEPPAYVERVRKFQDEAKKLDMKIVVPAVATGYCGRYLDVDSNLVAGVPVRNLAFIVKGKTAEPDPAQNLDVSLLKPQRHGKGVAGTLKCKPFTWYRMTYEIVPAQEGRIGSYCSISSNGHKRRHSRTEPAVKKTDEGRYIYQNVFNSLEAEEVLVDIYHNVHKLENVRIEPAGMLLIIRRDRIPLTVTSEDGKTVYEEGRDFKPVVDPIVAVRPFPGEFPFDHPAPVLELTENSRIRDGEKLLVSFWHHQRIGSDQDNLSLQEERVWPILEKEIREMQNLWHPEGFMLNYDEIRVAMWEPPEPGEEKFTPGQKLAKHFRRAYDLTRRIAPQAKIYTWSDMFTPHHNARPFEKGGYYYLVNGTWDGAWEGLPRDVIILNWYSPKPEGMKFFSDRGHLQVLCGYYDGRNTDALKKNIHQWRTVAEGVPNVRGVMFTTWERRYPFMKEYFQLLDTYDRWKGEIPAPAKK
ncbi:MAG TPA: hypothetical protein VMZ92_10285 [Planctomycetota bacterium]|nr:hypothetical protein [Planctomycetota bacterium]